MILISRILLAVALATWIISGAMLSSGWEALASNIAQITDILWALAVVLGAIAICRPQTMKDGIGERLTDAVRRFSGSLALIVSRRR